MILPNDSWFGLTLGSYSMEDSDILAFQAASNSSKFTDYFGVGYTHPVEDLQQDWTGAFQHKDSEVHFSVQRPLDTADTQGKDFTFPLDEPFTVGYAF